ncbi:2-C-methyl-D-erythritol 2,4-cyclodiphosphate synthase [Anaerofustis stercorihominis]|uniref:2-C-methyl-D-erythritol 2,4-cyclodiphosphate synthase n=1 Tax=Anaerofustis stercorihominis DSM 17244 TaxID=445971 RepID=B1C8Q5_9FIRM|nr:2-C-methyl-D-erythritol 2,4-cyclodiphosphate synthase [Anaerofustis stercorihominis]EDS71965.1 2-C-methyl-D-erythritol 2,4-cyclodiphosphate synthase [Anaerofustis stercorihominis DSM 17244]
MRIGFGYDVHRLGKNEDLILAGEKIDYPEGLIGHSDADVLVHALMDSILGALALGDIGKHFPDTDDRYKGISSMLLLKEVCNLIAKEGYELNNADVTLVMQAPKIAPYIDKMRENISFIMNTPVKNISIKATTEEKLGFSGRKEGIKAYSVCLLKEKE